MFEAFLIRDPKKGRKLADRHIIRELGTFKTLEDAKEYCEIVKYHHGINHGHAPPPEERRPIASCWDMFVIPKSYYMFCEPFSFVIQEARVVELADTGDSKSPV